MSRLCLAGDCEDSLICSIYCLFSLSYHVTINCSLIAKRASDVITQTNNLEWWMILKISLRPKLVFLKHL